MKRNAAREVARANRAFHLAVASLGVEAIADALEHWNNVPQPNRPGLLQEWLDEAVRLVMTHYTLGAQIARAYYRLVRALGTGKTLPDPNMPEPKFVTLQSLRDEFARVSEPYLSLDTQAGLPGAPTPTDGATRIEVEQLDVTARYQTARDRAEARAYDNLANLGPGLRNAKLDSLDTTQPANVVDGQRETAHADAGARQAAAAGRIAMNGSRDVVHANVHVDRIGYARVSLTGKPCGWCAMLISRGPVYRSKVSAERNAEGQQYHDNDHCVSLPVFDDAQYQNSDEFALNRELHKLWPTVTDGYGGKDAISVWRKFIRQRYEGSDSAQAA